MNGDVTIRYGQWYRDAWAASPLAMNSAFKQTVGAAARRTVAPPSKKTAV